MSKLTDLAESWQGAHDVTAVTLRIKSTSFEACRFAQTITPPEGARHVNGDPALPYEREVIYALGDRPAAYRRSRFTCFRLPDDDRDWFIAGWADTGTAEDSLYAKYHPLGAWFVLHPWTPEEARIDEGERREYDRVPVEVLNPGRQ